ncbi:MAG: hypothetical protein ABIO44_09625 [Saprospiraceae bacterium]
MNFNKLCIALISTFICLNSCSPSLTPLTKEIISENKWNEAELKKIQFYIAKDLILTRRLSSGESNISGGKILIKDGEKIEQVVIKNGTPGVLLFMPKEDRFAICFDKESTEKFLIFGPNPKVRSRFVLMGKEWDLRSGKVSYNGKVYDTSTESAFNSLLVNLKRAKNLDQSLEVAKGRKIDD